ncbi:MAG: pyridoxal-phosphate dependent enzyme [Methanomicrobiales archaeon]|nr:pyridoxal-phosphate dependent enzyme [Methanomicrobiales archaeon]
MLTAGTIREAAQLIAGHVLKTPLVYSPTFSAATGAEVYLNLETLQKTGSFNVRGAMHTILLTRHKIPPTGVIAASAGNHAQGVAVAARLAGVPAMVVMPVWASLSKQEAARGYGAEVVLST